MRPNRIKRRHKAKASSDGGADMPLVPFIDMLTILVVFLLVHTSDVDVLPNTKSISIPESISQKKPTPTVVVMITKNELLVDGRSVAKINEIIETQETLIAPLKEALLAQADRILAAAVQEDIKDREVTILGDRNTPYAVLRKVMATCTSANYGKVSLAVVEREGGTAVRSVAAL